MSTRHLIVRGLVQGVGYRASFASQAQGLGLRGWVRNRLDGSVEALVEGEEQAVQAITDWAHQGPRAARVDEVCVSQSSEAAGQHFELRPTV